MGRQHHRDQRDRDGLRRRAEEGEQGATGSASDAAAIADARNPASVLPTWNVARNRFGLARQPHQRDLAAGEDGVEQDQGADQHQGAPVAIHTRSPPGVVRGRPPR
jgi:hypothetical protein